jgi:hypothetical protein
MPLNPNAAPPKILIPLEEEQEARKRACEHGCAELHTKINYLLSNFPGTDHITCHGTWDLTGAVERALWTPAEASDNDADIIDNYKDNIAEEIRKFNTWDPAWDTNADRSGSRGQNLFREHVHFLVKAPKTAPSAPYVIPSPIETLQ